MTGINSNTRLDSLECFAKLKYYENNSTFYDADLLRAF